MAERATLDRDLVDRLAGNGMPDWLGNARREAWRIYEREEVPHWRRSGFWTTSLKELDLHSLDGHVQSSSAGGHEQLPEVARAVIDAEAPAGVIVQSNGSTVFTRLSRELADQGVVLSSLEEAVREQPELIERYYMRCLSAKDDKFTAATAALWTGGAFVYIPPEVKVTEPLMVVYVIDQAGVAQFAHTLVAGDRFSELVLRDFYLAPDIDGQALHSGALEIYLEDGAQCRLASFQDWGTGRVFDISRKRVHVGHGARVRWTPIHLGGHLTRQRLEIATAEKGAEMAHQGIYFAERDEHLDLYTVDDHIAGQTTGDTTWRGALAGSSRASYEGLIRIARGAQETNTYLKTHTMMLSPDAKADAIPSLIVEADNVSASHGGTVGEINEDKIFYMQSRGLSREEAVKMVVEGYFEPTVSKLGDPGLERLCRERITEKLSRVDSLFSRPERR